jgi:hypothetical protein
MRIYEKGYGWRSFIMVAVIFVVLKVYKSLMEKEEFDRVKDRYPPINNLPFQ